MKLILILIIFLVIAYSKKTVGADTILFNGVFVTLEDSLPEASALAIKGDKILAIGSLADLQIYQKYKPVIQQNWNQFS